MKIVTMATESYSNWLYHFLSSVNSEVVVYRINFSNKLKRVIEKEFPKVIFRDYETELILHEKWNPLNKVFKVTYLKGLFIKKAFEEFKEKILWSDCTELILGDLNEFEDKFGTNGFRIKRYCKAENKKTFAALFGLFGKREINKYYDLCIQNKNEWFSDQLALVKLNLSEIEQGNWISFNYDDEAMSWSDRGESGNGKITKSDYSFVEEKYINKLTEKYPKYKSKFKSFMKKIEVPTILVHIDDDHWCYATSCQKVAEILKDDFDFKLIYNAQKQKQEILNINPDLVWVRCSSLRNRNLLSIRPNLRNKCFTSITSGGEVLDNRMSRNTSNLTEAGLIVQNKESIFLAKYYMNKLKINKPIILFPNGCDIEKFKPVNKNKFVVGWNGRAGTPGERDMKGYNFYKKSVEILKYETLELTGEPKTKIPYKDLAEKFYNKISVLVLPSNGEGCSNTINEALSSGVPVLAYKVGWHGEVCKEVDDGIIFIERNLIDITNKLKKFEQNPNYLKKMSENARKFAERHSWEKVSKTYKKNFKEMIKYSKNLVPEVIENKNIDINGVEKEYIIVEGLTKTNLGKLEKIGNILWFEVGTKRKVPYYGKNKSIIDNYIKNHSLKRVD